jgi:uracil-DNA glycosylase family 4
MTHNLIQFMDEVERLIRNELHAGESELLMSPVKKKQKKDSETLLAELEQSLQGCTRCKLHTNRHTIVFGTGNPGAELMFVGEGPGADEDAQGIPFVGRAGKLLTRIIEAMGFKRDDVYICNVVKCRPPENRTPEPDEIGTCSPFLRRQIAFIRPKVICCLGLPAAQTILDTKQSMRNLRGKFFDYNGIKVLPTYHPAYLLRNPSAKRLVWEDVQKIMEYLGKKIP